MGKAMDEKRTTCANQNPSLAVEIAGGTNKKFDFLKDYSMLFEKVSKVYLATDKDGPG